MPHNKIAFRFCGGCNPRYDRREFLSRLRQRVPGAAFAPYAPGAAWLAVVLLCGCSARCVTLADLPAALPRLWASATGDPDGLAHALNTLCKENQ